jgi:dTDP-4-amino-4,6-dideoxygalactose transaminase
MSDGSGRMAAGPDSPPAPTSSDRWRVPLSDVRLPEAAVEAAREVLESGWLSSGPRVAAFEEDLAAYVGTRHAIACANGTSALELAYWALGIGAGDEVAMPSLTFVAGANVARIRGAEPVFCDVVGEDDLTIDPDSLARQAGPRTKAVVLMHYGGHPCRPEVIAVARERGLAVIEDAAHALGAAGAPGRCGAWGDVACFSFFANKNLPLGEGGAVTTDDPELAERVVRLRSHGMTSATWERHTGAEFGYEVPAPGHNFRFDEARAAMGSVLLAGLDDANRERGGLTARYRELLAGLDGVDMPFASRPSGEVSAHHLAVARLTGAADRDAVAGRLAEAGVQTSLHYPPTHRFAAHAASRANVERTEALAGRLLTLPLYPHMGEGSVEVVAAALGAALR